eukprot:NODE_346_length_10492_cov_0.275955.p8 type:complete len:105 gc:universal NODE_346_length_10492_cov_0.275955:7358-7044(-)
MNKKSVFDGSCCTSGALNRLLTSSVIHSLFSMLPNPNNGLTSFSSRLCIDPYGLLTTSSVVRVKFCINDVIPLFCINKGYSSEYSNNIILPSRANKSFANCILR